MNEEKQKVLNIFDKRVTLKRAENREKQAKIKKLLINNIKIEGNKNGNSQQK
ncbi:MAG: hypothetical protein IJ509_04060 [Bacilli bacterium]|nr:hypothetical protein [Bacilli bacterium]